MKASKLFFLLTVFSIIGISANAQRVRPRERAAVRHADKVHARRVIRRTAYVILAAQKQVREGKNYTGDLARSIAHQRFARKLFFQGEFLRAMHQSRRARQFAILAIQANKGTETADMKYNPEDEQIMNANPASDADLDKELDAASPGYSTNDADFVNAALDDIDLTDMQ